MACAAFVWRTSMTWRTVTGQSYRFFSDCATVCADNFGQGVAGYFAEWCCKGGASLADNQIASLVGLCKCLFLY